MTTPKHEISMIEMGFNLNTSDRDSTFLIKELV